MRGATLRRPRFARPTQAYEVPPVEESRRVLGAPPALECSGCGASDLTVSVVSDDGKRHCRRCLGGQVAR